MLQRTLLIIKPDAVKANHIGDILSMLEECGFKVRGMRFGKFGRGDSDDCDNNTVVDAFYSEHKGKPFFEGLCNFMSSGPSVSVVLERDNAIARLREVLGATDPKQAMLGTVRAALGNRVGPIWENAAHGSDSPEAAEREIAALFVEYGGFYY